MIAKTIIFNPVGMRSVVKKNNLIYRFYLIYDISLILLINRFPSLFSTKCETPPDNPDISKVFKVSTSSPKNIVLNTLNKSPCDTTIIFSSSLDMISSKNGFSLFHSSLRLSASENNRSSIVLSSCSIFSRSQ